MKINKIALAILAAFSVVSLASCGGDKPYSGDDNIVLACGITVCEIKDASEGFLVRASGHLVDHDPKNLKLNISDSTVTYKPAGETQGYVTQWIVTPTKIGDFTVTASVGNLKSNVITLSVIDNIKKIDVKFSMTSDMSITYQASDDSNIKITKSADTYMRSNLDDSTPSVYASKIANDSYNFYATKVDKTTGERSWVKRSQPYSYARTLNLISSHISPSGLEDEIYTSKEEKNITVCGTNYKSDCYTLKATDLINNWITKLYVVTTNDFCLILKQESNRDGGEFIDDFKIKEINVGSTTHPFPGPTE